jgi:hypothetical protein
MKAYWGSGSTAPHIDLATRWRQVISVTSWPLYPQGKSPRYPLDRRLGGPQSRSGCGGEEKNSQNLLGLKTPIIQPELSQFHHVVSRTCMVCTTNGKIKTSVMYGKHEVGLLHI